MNPRIKTLTPLDRKAIGQLSVSSVSLVLLLFVILAFSACQFDAGNTPELDTTELWPAGITHDLNISMDMDAMYPDSMLYGYINKKGEMVIPPQFVTAGSFSCGYAPVMLLGKEKKIAEVQESAFIDKKGNIHHIDGYPVKDATCLLTPFYYGMATLYNTVPGNNYSWSWMVNNQMNVVSECLHGALYPMTEDGLAAFIPNNKETGVFYYDKSCQKILEIYLVSGFYDQDIQFKDDYIAIPRRNKQEQKARYYIINTKGQTTYEDSCYIHNLGNQRFLRQKQYEPSDDQFDVIDAYGHPLGSKDFSAPATSKEQQVLCRSLGLTNGDYYGEYYYVNQDGKQTIKDVFCYAEPFYEGYAVTYKWNTVTKEASPYEIINLKGETVLTLENGERATRVHNGLILTQKGEYIDDDKYAYIRYYEYKDISGRVIYSWQEKELNLKTGNSLPARNKNRLTILQDGLYILGE